MVGVSLSSVILVLTGQSGKVIIKRLIDIPIVIINALLKSILEMEAPINGICINTPSEVVARWAAIMIDLRMKIACQRHLSSLTDQCYKRGPKSVKRCRRKG